LGRDAHKSFRKNSDSPNGIAPNKNNIRSSARLCERKAGVCVLVNIFSHLSTGITEPAYWVN